MKQIKNSLRSKLLIAFTAIGVIPVIVLGCFIIQQQQKVLFAEVERGLQNNLNQLCRETEQLLESVLQVQTETQQMQQMLQQLEMIQQVKTVPIEQAAFVLQREYNGKFLYLELNPEYFQKHFSRRSEVLSSDILVNDSTPIQNSETTMTVQAEIFENYCISQQFDLNRLLGNVAFWNETTVRVGLIMMIVSICMACGISYYISDGVTKLTEEIKRTAQGDFSSEPMPEGEDEIATLTRAFRAMKAELDTMVNRTLKLKISEREAQIKALQSQISPHFLYNALDSVNWSLIEKGDWENSEVLVALSAMLRYSIDNSKELVFLQQEAEQVKNYLIVQQNRFSDRFHYEISVDEDVKNIMVPKMILQPLAENAIQHGLQQAKDGLLSIRAKKVPQGVQVTVLDTGCGMSAERLQQLCQSLQQEEQMEDKAGIHIGLANVNSRLKYVFGKQSGLRIKSKQGEYTKIILLVDLGLDIDENIDCGR